MNISCQRIYCFLLYFSLLTSCTTNRYIYPDPAVKNKRLNLGLLTPNCILGVIQEGNKMIYDSTASRKAQKRITDLFKETVSQHTSIKEIVTDTASYRKIYQEVFQISSKMRIAKTKSRKQQIVDSCSISKGLDSLMQVNQIDQLVITYQQGFYRTKANYKKQNLKATGVGLLTLGLYIPVPIGSQSLLVSWVIDRNKKALVFSNLKSEEMHPTNMANLKQQVCELYLKFYTGAYSDGVCYPLLLGK